MVLSCCCFYRMCYPNEKNIYKLSRVVCQAVLILIPYAFYSQVPSNYCLTRNFCLLCFYPEPVRSSICNLVDEGSPKFTILTPNLVCTIDRHKLANDRSPALKPFDTTGSVVPRSQARATTPSESTTKNIVFK